MTKRLIAVVVAVGLFVAGPACARKNEDKLALQKLLEASKHNAGVYRYSDRTPTTPFAAGSVAQVRGLIEDDFRYKARLTVDGTDALDEVVNDDALAVRFLDPTFIPKFTTKAGDASTFAALSARYWVTDPTGAPSIGDAAVSDRVIGVDPIVDSLSVIDYALDAVSASLNVFKWNAERLDYRPDEDPFPRPARGSGITRWDLVRPPMPRADALQTGQGDASLARVPHFRQMAIYVKDGKIIQIREEIGAKFDLLEKFRDYMVQFAEKEDEKAAKLLETELDKLENQPAIIEALLNFNLNVLLDIAGEDPVRFRTMVYEFDESGDVNADLPFGPEVKAGKLDFFGVNSKSTNTPGRRIREIIETGSTTTTSTTLAR